MSMMRKWTVLLGLLVLAGCGGEGDPRVQSLVPGARDVRCARASDSLTRCEAHTGNGLVGERTWTCEFTYRRGSSPLAYAGTGSCWSDSR
jgi:hypothetical protein